MRRKEGPALALALEARAAGRYRRGVLSGRALALATSAVATSVTFSSGLRQEVGADPGDGLQRSAPSR